MKSLMAIPLFALAASVSALGAGLTADQLASWDISIGGSLAGTENVTESATGVASAGGFTYQGVKIQNEYTIKFGANGLIDAYTATVSAAGKSATFAGTV